MASWDFTIDSDKQNELAGKLSEAADNFDTKVSLLYGQIDSMNGTSWIGEDYDTFHTGVHNYEGALKDLSNGFRMFSEHYKLMAEGTNTLASDLINIIKNMTGTNGVDYSSGGGSASYGSGAGRSDVVGNDGDNSHSSSMSAGADDTSSTNLNGDDATHGGGGHRHESNQNDLPVDTEEVIEKSDTMNTGIPHNENLGETFTNPVVVDDDAFLGSTTYAQFSSGGGVTSRVYLNEDMSIYYEDGKVVYPDGRYEEKNLRNMYDFQEEWKKVNNYMFESEVPIVVPSGYKLVDDGAFLGSTTYAQFSENGAIPVYFDEAQTIYYENGKIYYPDGHYEEKNLRNMYDFQEEWKEINHYVYEDDCR